MQIGLFSDVHGNAVAFDALLADLDRRPVDRLVCLGDVVQGGPQPVECLERLRALNCQVVMGNADWYVLTGDPGVEPETESQRRNREWSLGRLSQEDRAYIRSFTPTVDEPPVLAFHGSPGSFEDVILPTTPEDDFRRVLSGAEAPILTGGHTHLQFVRRRGDSLFLNPGSVVAVLVTPHRDPASVNTSPRRPMSSGTPGSGNKSSAVVVKYILPPRAS